MNPRRAGSTGAIVESVCQRWDLSCKVLISSELFFLLGCSRYFNSIEGFLCNIAMFFPKKERTSPVEGAANSSAFCLGPVVCLPNACDQRLQELMSFF